MHDDDERPACCFDDWAAYDARRARRGDRVAGITSSLLDTLEEAGLRDRTVLDVGCGAGVLALGALRRGAQRTHGIDLGEGAIEHARALADERGLAERSTFEVGDGSRAQLPRADVVVLNRVVCCYPDVGPLLDNSLRAAGAVYAFTAPADRGVAGVANRIQVACANAWYRLRRNKFRTFRVFVHPLEELDARVRGAGFRAFRRERRRLLWELAVYTREDAAA